MTKEKKTKAQKAAIVGTPEVALIALSTIQPAESNVRKGPLASIESLATSILETGLQQSLKVELTGKNAYRVINGSRRYAALQSLIEAKKINNDYQVPCIIEANSDISKEEQQLVENIERCPLNAVDEMEAFAKIIEEEKASIPDLAKRFSTTERHVKQRLRLGTLAAPIREFLREGKISLDIAKQFAAVSDQERQLQVFQIIDENQNWNYVQPWSVKQKITDASYAADSKLAKFVTVDAYSAKGGNVEEDLFEDQVRLTDGALLEALAQAKLQEIADGLAKSEDWGWGAGLLEDPNHVNVADIQINSYSRELTPEEKEEFDQTTQKLLDLEDSELTEEDEKRYDALEKKLDAINQSTQTYNAAEKAVAGVRVSITDDGMPNVSRGWVKEEDIKRLEVLRETGEKPEAPAAKKPEKKDLSAPLIDDLTAERTFAARIALLNKPEYAIDLMLYAMARRVEHYNDGPLSFSLSGATVSTTGQHKIEGRSKVADKATALNKSWCGKNYLEGFHVFRALSDTEKQAWAAFAMQQQILDNSWWYTKGGKGTDFDKLSAFLGADIRATFTPDADYFNRYVKGQLLDVAEELGGGTLRNYLVGLKKGEMVSVIAGIFDGTVDDYGTEPIEKAKTWLPKNMAFPAAEAEKPKKAVKKSAAQKTAAQKTVAKKTAAKSSAKRGTNAAKTARSTAKQATKTKQQPAAQAA